MKVNISQKEKKFAMKGREPRKTGFLLRRLPSMNRSFQTKPQSYRVKQQEGSEELSSHTGHKCSPGAAQLGLVGHSSVKAPPAGQVCRQLNGPCTFTGCISWETQACAETTGICFHPHRLQEHFTPTGVHPWDGFLQVRGLRLPQEPGCWAMPQRPQTWRLQIRPRWRPQSGASWI